MRSTLPLLLALVATPVAASPVTIGQAPGSASLVGFSTGTVQPLVDFGWYQDVMIDTVTFWGTDGTTADEFSVSFLGLNERDQPCSFPCFDMGSAVGSFTVTPDATPTAMTASGAAVSQYTAHLDTPVALPGGGSYALLVTNVTSDDWRWSMYWASAGAFLTPQGALVSAPLSPTFQLSGSATATAAEAQAPIVTPEPSTVLLFLLGTALLMLRPRRMF